MHAKCVHTSLLALRASALRCAACADRRTSAAASCAQQPWAVHCQHIMLSLQNPHCNPALRATIQPAAQSDPHSHLKRAISRVYEIAELASSINTLQGSNLMSDSITGSDTHESDTPTKHNLTMASGTMPP